MLGLIKQRRRAGQILDGKVNLSPLVPVLHGLRHSRVLLKKNNNNNNNNSSNNNNNRHNEIKRHTLA